MRRIWILLCAAALVVTLPIDVAGGKGRGATREARKQYSFSPVSGGGFTGWFDSDYGIFFGRPATFASRAGERIISVEIADDSGSEVAAAVWQRGRGSLDKVICTRAAHLGITGGKPAFVQVFLETTPRMYAGCEAPALPTKGTISLSFR